VDGEGLVVEDLERHLKTKKVRMIYLTPLHHYPTTVTLSASRRLRLYEVCYDREFPFLKMITITNFITAASRSPLASFDPGGIVFYVSTFSKFFFLPPVLVLWPCRINWPKKCKAKKDFFPAK